MKIKPEHYALLEQAIQSVQPRFSLKSYRQDGLSDMRYRWDMLYASGIKIGDGKGMPGIPIYAYCSDFHIDTALRRITGTTK